jgi:hypothetical protein
MQQGLSQTRLVASIEGSVKNGGYNIFTRKEHEPRNTENSNHANTQLENTKNDRLNMQETTRDARNIADETDQEELDQNMINGLHYQAIQEVENDINDIKNTLKISERA